jgi:dihydroxyacetone kinase-like protein
MSEAAESIRRERDHLTQLDAAIGDGDHGVNMDRGFDAVGKAMAGQDGSVPPGRLLILAGKTLVSTVGGASGPLWGTAFRQAGRALGDREDLDGPGLVEALDAAVAGVVDLAPRRPATRR